VHAATVIVLVPEDVDEGPGLRSHGAELPG
jgi:hypothetical protein